MSEICKRAEINRSTFYANFEDIYDLAQKVRERLEQDIIKLYSAEISVKGGFYCFRRLFSYIEENKLLYLTYMKLDYDNSLFIPYDEQLAREFCADENLEYHLTFFRNGLNAVIKLWIKNGCKESPKQMNDIIKAEYKRKY